MRRIAMLRIFKLGMCCAVFTVSLASVPPLWPQQATGAATAPVPVQIINGRKVFISNVGVDGIALTVVTKAGDPQQPYDELYAAMKAWGRYTLVGAPADADLVMEIRFTAPLTDCGKETSYGALLNLAILDAKTHFTLWTLTQPVEGAFREATWKKNFSQGISNLVDDLKKLTT
jgi:hypothetical protein